MSDSESESSADSSLRERGGTSKLKLWIFLQANRWILVSILTAGLFATIVLVGIFWPASPRSVLLYQDPVDTVFQGLISGTITGVTLILTINQLIISQQLGPLGQQRDRLEGAVQFRQDIEERTALAVTPSHPSEFLQALVEAARRKAMALEEALDADSEEDVRDEIADTIDAITEDADDMNEQLDEAQFGSFSVLNAALAFDYSQKIHSVRRFRNLHESSLSEEVAERVNELLGVLEFFGPAREDIKTLYFQWELTNLSRGILYTGIPALASTYMMILFFEPREYPGVLFGVPEMLWIVSLGMTIGTLPFLVLVAYVLRIATVAKRTAAIGPLVLRTTDQEGEIEWVDNSE